ncbi:MAG TPA: hypothetical protein VNI57_11845 [Candidatus Saccharimonadales bacterium]|nr:hypothetical protein [Candidatus Saccharimonadales bacterium]
MDTVTELGRICRAFGPDAAARKARLMEKLIESRLTRRALRLLAPSLLFLRAYPDSARIRSLSGRLAARFPETAIVHPWSYGVLLRLARLEPGGLEISWDDLENEDALTEALYLLVSLAESHGLEDIGISLREWIEGSKPRRGVSDLAFLLDLLGKSPWPPQMRAFLLENAQIPVRYRGPALPRLALEGVPVACQKRAFDRKPFPLPAAIRRRPRSIERGGREIIDLALRTLCARTLEIYPLTWADPADVTVVSDGRGIQVAVAGVRPEWRGSLEVLAFVLVLKNGVPIAYGPARAVLGCCELGINLFAEFRGGETRLIYARFMQALHHVLGVEHFFLTRYGMGENNADALRSGAFWFYRKLGFRTTSPAVEKLAREEEARMASRPGYRSGMRTLRRLSHTEAHLDLSGGRLRPLDLGRLGTALSRFIGSAFDGDRRLAERRCTAQLRRILGAGAPGRSFRELAPLLCMIPDLPAWSRREKSSLAAFLRAKDAVSEARAARLQAAMTRFGDALHGIAGTGRV